MWTTSLAWRARRKKSSSGFLSPKTPIRGYKAAVLWRAVIWTIGHSQEGLRPGREIIRDREFESAGTLDVGERETPKPKIKIRERVWSCAEGRVGEERTSG
jgi:hypothetical protein